MCVFVVCMGGGGGGEGVCVKTRSHMRACGFFYVFVYVLRVHT